MKAKVDGGFMKGIGLTLFIILSMSVGHATARKAAKIGDIFFEQTEANSGRPYSMTVVWNTDKTATVFIQGIGWFKGRYEHSFFSGSDSNPVHSSSVSVDLAPEKHGDVLVSRARSDQGEATFSRSCPAETNAIVKIYSGASPTIWCATLK